VMGKSGPKMGKNFLRDGEDRPLPLPVCPCRVYLRCVRWSNSPRCEAKKRVDFHREDEQQRHILDVTYRDEHNHPPEGQGHELGQGRGRARGRGRRAQARAPVGARTAAPGRSGPWGRPG